MVNIGTSLDSGILMSYLEVIRDIRTSTGQEPITELVLH